MRKDRPVHLLSFIFPIVLCISAACQQPKIEFIPLDSARPILEGFSNTLPAEIHKSPDKAEWSAWVQAQDADVRQRLELGEEDTLTNLLRFGVTYTDEYQIDREYLSRYGKSTLVNAFADKRADDLIRTLSSSTANEGMQQMRAFLIQRGYSFKTPEDRARIKQHLLDNLARMRDEFEQFREKLKGADLTQQSELYSQRGISLDSNLWPDYALDLSLSELAKAGMLKPGSVRRIAIIGPGLDFVNKEYGNDFYPPQSIQPFAVLDSLIRLGLTDAKSFQLYTFDISPSVNIHLERARKNAAAGKPYIVQLPWNSAVPFTQQYLAKFESYWQSLGMQIGAPVSPVQVPFKLADQIHIRAVRIRPEIAMQITPVDMNIVYQRVEAAGQDEKFDLIIGTNIFIYYDAFEQSLARANLAAMLKPGGFALTNDILADKVTSQLEEAHRTTIEVRSDPNITERVFCYRRQP
jgi:chemotaxis methyl-accepting protein methylase